MNRIELKSLSFKSKPSVKIFLTMKSEGKEIRFRLTDSGPYFIMIIEGNNVLKLSTNIGGSFTRHCDINMLDLQSDNELKIIGVDLI